LRELLQNVFGHTDPPGPEICDKLPVWAAGANLTLLWLTLGWQCEGRALHHGRARPLPSPSLVNYYVFDGHGSVRALTDASGNVTDTYDYDAFGNLLYDTGTTANVSWVETAGVSCSAAQ